MNELDALLDKDTPISEGRVSLSSSDGIVPCWMKLGQSLICDRYSIIRETGHNRQQRDKEVINKGWNISNKC
jgi:hypothetical protein